MLIITACLFCISCGVKSDPKYETKKNYNKKLKII